MKYGILGSGMVAQTIGKKLLSLGHQVTLGTRDTNKLSDWLAANNGEVGSFADAAAFGDILINATAGTGSLAALELAGKENLQGKILIDISNPLDFSQGMPPSLFVSNTNSLGEEIQKAFPETKVVKTLNTTNCEIMVDARRVADGNHSMFVAGNDAEAKATVSALLCDGFGWSDVIDLGDISAARTTEMLLPIWVRLWGTLGTADFNFKIVR